MGNYSNHEALLGNKLDFMSLFPCFAWSRRDFNVGTRSLLFLATSVKDLTLFCFHQRRQDERKLQDHLEPVPFLIYILLLTEIGRFQKTGHYARSVHWWD